MFGTYLKKSKNIFYFCLTRCIYSSNVTKIVILGSKNNGKIRSHHFTFTSWKINPTWPTGGASPLDGWDKFLVSYQTTALVAMSLECINFSFLTSFKIFFM